MAEPEFKLEPKAPLTLTKAEAWTEVVNRANTGDVEEMLSALGDYFEVDAAGEDHPTVKQILYDLSETMHKASIDYYVSTK